MTNYEHQRVVNELQQLIDDTQDTLSRFEATGMDAQMKDDYEKLLEVIDHAIKQQHKHTLAMLS